MPSNISSRTCQFPLKVFLCRQESSGDKDYGFQQIYVKVWEPMCLANKGVKIHTNFHPHQGLKT